MPTPIIQAEKLGKSYRLGVRQELPDTAFGSIKRMLLSPFRNIKRLRELDTSRASGNSSEDLFWALKDVSFTIDEGEVVGIIGRNGAGKSTLLKILSRITSPTSGSATLDGRVCSLLEVGTGFHPDLTGRENVYMNGTILGMRKREIDRKFDEIVAFSGVESFLDTPIKRYSSGMQVRLAFAVAAHLEPEILIIDEVLAVGDNEFQKRCLGKMKDVARSGRTVLFVSHNMHAIRTLTRRAMLLDQGRLKCFDDTSNTIDTYLEGVTDHDDRPHPIDVYRQRPTEDSPVRIVQICVADQSTGPETIACIESASNLVLELQVLAVTSVAGVYISISLNREGQTCVGTAFSGDQDLRIELEPGLHTITCDLGPIPLSPGRYLVTAGLNRSTSSLAYDLVADFPVFDVNLPALDRAELGWPQRPWGAIDLSRSQWAVRQESDRSGP
tara:strand:+ start:104939 stop:106264 length:1326 start_codon:yes stop_codon:yes gene_type:complete